MIRMQPLVLATAGAACLEPAGIRQRTTDELTLTSDAKSPDGKAGDEFKKPQQIPLLPRQVA
jgi:hypothetical protein